jgi:hypothetical protein
MQALAMELATLLTLQLPSLPPGVLAGCVAAVGSLAAEPRAVLWGAKAAAALERASGRCALEALCGWCERERWQERKCRWANQPPPRHMGQ